MVRTASGIPIAAPAYLAGPQTISATAQLVMRDADPTVQSRQSHEPINARLGALMGSTSARSWSLAKACPPESTASIEGTIRTTC